MLSRTGQSPYDYGEAVAIRRFCVAGIPAAIGTHGAIPAFLFLPRTPIIEPPVPLIRILDAAANRASEGLRVVEDYVRFVIDDPHLTRLVKSARHELAEIVAAWPATERHAARETLRDVGTDIDAPDESKRTDAWAVCAASFERVKQSLRSLEEYAKIVDGTTAGHLEDLRYGVYTLEKAVDSTRGSIERLATSRLCVLVPGGESESDFGRLIQELVAAGVGAIQLRDKSIADRELVGRARKLRELTRDTATLAIINDRPDVAALVAADGVHLGQEDLSVKDARNIVGPKMLIGVSTHNIAQARQAVLDGANYLGAGPTFPSATKKFDNFAGLEFLREVAAEIRLPTFAIGGIGAQNLAEVLATGIARVAVSDSITQAADPAFAASELLSMLNDAAAHATALNPTSDL